MNRFAPMPEVGPPTPLRLPPMADTRLPSGLRVVAARYPSIPMAELRLAIPLAPVPPTRPQSMRCWQPPFCRELRAVAIAASSKPLL